MTYPPCIPPSPPLPCRSSASGGLAGTRLTLIGMGREAQFDGTAFSIAATSFLYSSHTYLLRSPVLERETKNGESAGNLRSLGRDSEDCGDLFRPPTEVSVRDGGIAVEGKYQANKSG